MKDAIVDKAYLCGLIVVAVVGGIIVSPAYAMVWVYGKIMEAIIPDGTAD